MTANELYNLINDNELECHFLDEMYMVWIPIDFLQDFVDLLSPGLFDEGGIDCKLQSGYIWIDLTPIFDYYGFEYDEFEALFPELNAEP